MPVIIRKSTVPAYFFVVGVVVAGGLAVGAFDGVAAAGLAAGAELLLETWIAS